MDKRKNSIFKSKWWSSLSWSIFLVSIISSILGRFNFQADSPFDEVGFAILSIGMAFLGMFFIYQSLKVIESVAITSDETSFTRDKEAFKSAFREMEEAKKPELELHFIDESPPFHINIGQVKTLYAGLELKRCEAARSPIIGIIAPAGFNFPGMNETLQSKSADHPGYIATFVRCNNCILGYTEQYSFSIKAPDQKDVYKLYWNICCENLPNKEIEFEIIVE